MDKIEKFSFALAAINTHLYSVVILKTSDFKQ